MAGAQDTGRFAGGRLAPAVAGLTVIAAVLALYVAQPVMVRRLDARVYDLLLPLAARGSLSPVPLIVDIDDASLAAYGQWPWSRLLLARLVDSLVANGAASVALDILPAEEDRGSPDRLQRDLKRDAGIDIRIEGLPESLRNYDTLLGETLRGLPVVLGAYARYQSAPPAGAETPRGLAYALHTRADAVDFTRHMTQATDALLPLPVLRHNAALGFINMSPDPDGLVRRIPLLFLLRGEVQAGLSLRALMTALDKNTLVLEEGPNGLESVRVGSHSIPLSPDGTMLVPFQGPRKTYPYLSAADVLRGTASPEAIRGRIVLIGASAPGLMDIRATPLDRVYPGVETHAAALDAILSGTFLVAPPWTPGLQIVLIALCGAFAATVFGLARPLVYLPAGLGLMAAVFFAARACFTHGVFISPLYALGVIGAQGGIQLFLRFAREEKQKLVLRNAFSHYVSPEVVKRITRLQNDIFAGEERELSIMFTDIRRFTSLSENLGPRQIVLLLNRYFAPMTALVRASGGTLDKFIGDALMAFWNAPVDVPGHPERAVETALAMRQRLRELNPELEQAFGIRLDMGVGVHTGKAYVGNMGSADMLNYTLIGDAVNLTARLEGLCPLYGAEVVVSGETAAACGEAFGFRPLDTLTVKGKHLPVDVYEPLPRPVWEQRAAELSAWLEARRLYTAGAFAEAAARCAALNREHPETALYALYTERCRKLAAAPPPDWKGVWARHTD